MISRRSLLSAAPFALAACGAPPESEEIEMSRQPTTGSGVPPWHMWGSSQGFQLGPTSDPNNAAFTVQLASIRYKRPENWQFMLGMRLITATAGGAAAVVVLFDLSIGVGRSMMVIPAWHGFRIQYGGNQQQPIQKWVTQVQPPAVNDALPAVLPGPCNAITAETVNLSARVFWNPFNITQDTASIQVDALFSPSTHVRPEWYEHSYPGGELGGA